MRTSTKKVTKENKSEFGMNRNEFFEYKKQRCMDLAQKGATVGEIAKDLGMTEKEMYAFLSRNFGGIRQMRSAATSGFGIPQLSMAGMSVGTAVEVAKEKSAKKHNAGDSVKRVQKEEKPASILSAFAGAMEEEKQHLLKKFKREIEADTRDIIVDVQIALGEMKSQLLSNFKEDLLKDLSTMAKGL